MAKVVSKTVIAPGAGEDDQNLDASLMDLYNQAQGGGGEGGDMMGGQEGAPAEEGAEAQAAEAGEGEGLEITTDQLTQMKAYKDAGDFEALGQYVAGLI